MMLSESKKPKQDAAEVYRYLEENGWGFYSDKPVYIDKARPMNVFGERRIWLQQMQFLMAVLQLTNRCKKNCPDCGKTFCPICFSDRTEEKELTVKQWCGIIYNLAEAGCRTVMFTGGESLLYDGLAELIGHAVNLGLAVSVQTSGELPLDTIPADVNISVLINKSSDIDRVLENLRDRKKVSLILQGVDRSILGGRSDMAWDVRHALPVRRALRAYRACGAW